MGEPQGITEQVMMDIDHAVNGDNVEDQRQNLPRRNLRRCIERAVEFVAVTDAVPLRAAFTRCSIGGASPIGNQIPPRGLQPLHPEGLPAASSSAAR